MQLYANHFTIFPWILGSSTLQLMWGSSDLKNYGADRAISDQRCNESTQYHGRVIDHPPFLKSFALTSI